MKLNIPAKTFLVGEYSVLSGGSALGLATKPCFEVSYTAEEGLNIHPDSPAGRYRLSTGRNVDFSMKDPYEGGFGRSTAEYLACVVPDLIEQDREFSKILHQYKSFHGGSGIDLAFQYFGNICLADAGINFYQTFDWHFANLDFYILTTGFKVKTHEHLASLDKGKIRDLPELSNKITQLFAENNEDGFLNSMKEWSRVLSERGLTHDNSMKIKNHLECFEPVYLAKPCGALGADVILVFFDKTQKLSVKKILIDNNYRVVAHTSDLTAGVKQQLNEMRGRNVG